ncbi:hypothetical protein [Corynebacterium sp. Marseille-P8863]|uniref:hypothetical protein n=1 Tax=Corynebacterium sp. Marseille-P8863 TaxID=2866576 RepID=UPI0022654F81|nr:hypothetical protein [Corynebacterium sp. Marseille-P8863]
MAPLQTDRGPAWSIDGAVDALEGAQVRKLTGQSGRVGEGDNLDAQVRVSAINVTKALQQDLRNYASKPSRSLTQQIEQKLLFTRALLGNDVASLNAARADVLENHRGAFHELTGFTVAQRTKPGSADATLNYVLVPDTQKIEKLTAGDDEYVTVFLGKDGERLLSLYQPGLDLPDNSVPVETTSTEYHQFAGFTADEQSKTIDLDLRIKGHWTFDVTEGAKYVRVTRGERDHQLVLAPRPSLEGDGTATVVITDEQANEFIYHLQLNNTINAEVPEEPEQIIDAPPRAPEETAYRHLPTSTVAYISNNGGTATVTRGEDLVAVDETEIGGTPVWKVTPTSRDQEGMAHVVVTDADGTVRPHVFQLEKRMYATKSIVHDSIPYGGFAKLLRPAGVTYDVVQGAEFVTVSEEDNAWIVNANKDNDVLRKNGGTAVIDLKDSQGRVVQNVTVSIERHTFNPEKTTRVHEVVDLSEVYLTPFSDEDNGFLVEPLDGATLEDFFENPEDYDGKEIWGDLKLKFKPGAQGKLKVTEFVRWATNDDGVDYDNVPITEHVYVVSPFKPIESEYTITSENELGLVGTRLHITEGGDLLEAVPADGESNITISPNRGASGRVVIEDRTESGHVFERSTVNITPGEQQKDVEHEMTWTSSARIAAEFGDSYKIVSAKDADGNDIDGYDLVRVREDDGDFVVTGRAGKIGSVTIAVSDKQGVYGTYTLTITESKGARVYNYRTSPNAEFRATLVEKSNKFVVIDGAEYLEYQTEDGNQWVAKPKADAAGKTATIEEWDEDGNVLNTWNLKIVRGATSDTPQLRDYLIIGQGKAYQPISEGNTFKVVQGANHVTTGTDDKGNFTLTPKSGGEEQFVVTEEYDNDGKLVRTIRSLIILREHTLPTDNEFEAPNKDIATARRDASTGAITISFGKEGGDIGIAEGADLVDITREGDSLVLTPKQGVRGTVSFVPVNDNVQNTTGYSFDIDTKSGADGNAPKDGSSDPKTVASSVGIATPLVLLLALIAVSQLPIPGLEGVRAQLNAAIDNAMKAFK